jgi:hypothetical protein
MKIVVDMLNEIIGQVEDDRIQQVAACEEIPQFVGTIASLDSLTIRQVP